MSGAEHLAVVVGIPTYRRPEKLAELLARLPARIDEVADCSVRVVVVDNDPAGSARDVCAHSPVPVVHHVEPTPGIAAVRNRILAESQDADLVAFIDDDERPLPDWLAALVSTWRTHRTDAVMGRVISVFAQPVDPWLRETGVYRRRERVTGSAVPVAAAGNLLVDVRQLRDRSVRFDERLGLAGGEDTLFSRLLADRGGRIVWCNESRAEDEVPADRLTREWAMRRAYNGGNLATQVDLLHATSFGERGLIRLKSAVGGPARIAVGLARHFWGRLTGHLTHDARGLRTAYRGWGMTTGSFGHLHEHYERPAAESTTQPQG
ncbi:glycosyltransferase [Aeromicrobium sp. zg-636]|uniref:Glycosyltransferase n=1 Tax=Aeromicrobium senzhongii TaxID=2663859 RepID=A0A8I0K383_9ACTN|nr:glycosyltransferase [Aeromicrobium sp. 636]MBC9227709.1 glycosyltransferase [Aeromicrobium senzhongii]